MIIADIQDGTTAAESLQGHFVTIDVSNPNSVQEALNQAVKLAGKLDILINNAGINGEDGITIQKSNNDLTKKIFEINTFGVMYGLKYGPDFMNDGGSIINTASLGASLMFPGSGPYSASKAAVVNLTQMAATELASRKIRVNAVAPSFIRTPMAEQDIALFEKIGEYTTCAERIAEPEDVAAAYHFLASDDSCYINGHILNLDGGMSVGFTNPQIDMLIDKANN